MNEQDRIIVEFIRYDKKTGKLFCKKTRNNKAIAGNQCGSDNVSGYKSIRIFGKNYKQHRVAWFLHYGTWPVNQIDHINGIITDNRIENLRDVTNRENAQNRFAHRNGKIVGASFFEKNNKWVARIRVKKRNKHLGYFKTKLEANAAYLKESKKLKES